MRGPPCAFLQCLPGVLMLLALGVMPFSLWDFVKGLLFADPGRFRLIVFIISDQPFAATGKALTAPQGEELLLRGFNAPLLDPKWPFSRRHEVSVLVYEFEKKRNHDAVQVTPGKLLARTHLEKANVWAGLETAPGR